MSQLQVEMQICIFFSESTFCNSVLKLSENRKCDGLDSKYPPTNGLRVIGPQQVDQVIKE